MSELLFGPAGVAISAKPPRSTPKGIERVHELGLGCMEMEFVQGVKMGRETAITVGKLAKGKGVVLSAHGPYAINLNSRESDKVTGSKQRILQTARIAQLCGARSIVFHAAFYLNDPPQTVYERVRARLSEICQELRKEGNRVWVRPELTGKPTQFGSLSELIRLSQEIEGVLPCVDFAHCHARSGKYNSYREFSAVFEELDKGLGRRALDNIHIHISGIKYTKAGEYKHLNLAESDFNYRDFARALADYEIQGLVISESPNLEEDSLLLQGLYRSLTGSIPKTKVTHKKQ